MNKKEAVDWLVKKFRFAVELTTALEERMTDATALLAEARNDLLLTGMSEEDIDAIRDEVKEAKA